VRSSVSRLKRRGLLLPARTAHGAAGYELSAEARQLLEDGDRRIYATTPPVDEGWVLAVFSVPESERQKRHVLRSRLAGLGFGTAAPGVWIAPARLHEETRHTLERLRLDAYVDLFRGEHLGFAPTARAVARWWDLAAIAKEHEAFLDRHERVLQAWERRADTPPQEAYRDYLLALDAWRHLPYTDPGLPAGLLPEDWPGVRSAAVFQGLHERLRDAGAEFAGLLPEA
jgi:phenylacetic acid degradation operon negative regulatory protein